MEVGLNLFWLLLALAGFCVWQWRGPRPGRARRSRGPVRRLLTLACALAVLFPVISLTDDLHGEQLAIDDSSRTLNKRAKAQACPSPAQACHSPAQVPRTPFAFSNCAFARALVADDVLRNL